MNAPDPAVEQAAQVLADLRAWVTMGGESARWSVARRMAQALAAANLLATTQGATHTVHVTSSPIAEDAVWCDECEEWVMTGEPQRAATTQGAGDGETRVIQEWCVDGDGYLYERRHRDDAADIAAKAPARRRVLRRTVTTHIGPWEPVDQQAVTDQ